MSDTQKLLRIYIDDTGIRVMGLVGAAGVTLTLMQRDLAALAEHTGRAVDETTVEELEAWVAEMRAGGLAASTIARRVSAVRSYFRHLVLIGARAENPAASVGLPRRPRVKPVWA